MAAIPPMTVPVLSLDAIDAVADPSIILDTVRAALVAHAEGGTMTPPPIHLAFPDADGDCHVKAGWVVGSTDFVVKIASGFYRNSGRGLPTNHGLMCLLSSRTGRVRAVLDDRGRLTAWRTAAAGALITHAMSRPDAATVGVFGTGEQARLQVTWLARLRPGLQVQVHGRDGRKADALCEWLGGRGLPARPASAHEAAGADIVVTTTPATSPVLDAAVVEPGAHVTGIGADMPHKNELPAELFGRAAMIATDDHDQCLHHGDFGHAVRAGTVAANADVAIGAILRKRPPRPASAITVADLTGVGALDAAVASRLADELLGPVTRGG